MVANTFEGGSQGTAITSGNSGGASGDPFNAVYDSPTYDGTQKAHGSYSMKCAGTAAYASWSFGTLSDLYFRIYLRATANDQLYGFQPVYAPSGAGSALVYLTNGVLQAYDTAWNKLLDFTTPVPADQWVRIEGHFYASASAGTMEVRLYNSPESSSPTETQTLTGANTGSGFTACYLGVSYAGYTLSGVWFDDIAAGPSGWFGPSGGAAFVRAGGGAALGTGCGTRGAVRTRAGSGGARGDGTGNRAGVRAPAGAAAARGTGAGALTVNWNAGAYDYPAEYASGYQPISG